MKGRFVIILFFLSSSFITAHASIFNDTDTISEVKIDYPKIIAKKKVVGTVKTLPVIPSDSKSENHKVQIFEKSGKLVAEYELEVLSDRKKNRDAIISAKIKTLKDNVVHNGNNFIDVHFKSSKNETLLQLNKVVEYLLKYKYL